jgi:predicted RecB family endonuclease
MFVETQFLDLMAHKNGKHFIVEVKTGKADIRKEQRKLLDILEQKGINTLVIYVKINYTFFIKKIQKLVKYNES